MLQAMELMGVNAQNRAKANQERSPIVRDNSCKLLPNKNEKESKMCQWEEMNGSKILENESLETSQSLSLRYENLNKLPNNFGFIYKHLKCLNLSNNKFRDVPSSLKLLVELEYLSISNNRLSYFPCVIAELTCLTELNLSRNVISVLPDSLAKLQFLEILILSFNKLKELPAPCKTMNQIRILNLSGNFFKEIPHCIVTGMTSLECLNLSENHSIDLSLKPMSQKLKKLYAENIQNMMQFPLWIFEKDSKNLQIAKFDGSSFKPFDFLAQKSNLSVKLLSFKESSISESLIKKVLNVASDLEILNLDNNSCAFKQTKFTTIAESFKRPEKVQEIQISAVEFSDISFNTPKFVNLKKLDIGNNYLNWLPDQICYLTNLHTLSVANNCLTELPENISDMSSLMYLIANRNNLVSLPKSFKKLRNLVCLDLYQNSFQAIPLELSCMERLTALDLDQNPVDIKNFRIRKINYQKLRDNLRKHNKITGFARQNGPRSMQYSSGIVENWDISDDSADEYDPNSDDGKPTKKAKATFSYLRVLARSCDYCPARSHPLPIKHQIFQKQQACLLPQNSNSIVDGQFNDA